MDDSESHWRKARTTKEPAAKEAEMADDNAVTRTLDCLGLYCPEPLSLPDAGGD